MRDKRLKVRYVDLKSINEIANPNGFKKFQSLLLGYAIIKDPICINKGSVLDDLVRNDLDSIRLIWLQGYVPISQQRAEFQRETKLHRNQTEYLARLFRIARSGRGLIIEYRQNEQNKQYSLHYNDMFRFSSRSSGLVLSNFKVQKADFGSYRFQPRIPEEFRNLDALVGLTDFTK